MMWLTTAVTKAGAMKTVGVISAAVGTTIAVSAAVASLPESPLNDDYTAALSQSQDPSGPAYDSRYNFTRVQWSGGGGGRGRTLQGRF